MERFEVSREVASLGTSLFLLGFGLGGLFWAPASEWVGRRIPFLLGYTIFIIFQIPVGVADNLETVLASRFIQGFFGSSTLAVIAGAFADLWPAPINRGVAMTIFTIATFAAPIIGSIAGSYIAQSGYSWRWTAWITIIISAIPCILGWVLMPETYQSNTSGSDDVDLATGEVAAPKLRNIIATNFSRPFRMLFSEPIVLLFSIYLALVYGIFYLFFTAFPISFHQQRQWPAGVGALPFLSVLVGIFAGSGFIIYDTKTRFARRLGSGQNTPEDRLPPMMYGSVLLPVGLFTFAWTSSPDITWVPQVLVGAPIGFGIVTIFLQGINYIVDCYKQASNSALASSTLLRGLSGTAFPLFASTMYASLGVDWATSVLAFVTVCLTPVSFLFYRYGTRLRSVSRYTPQTRWK
ncbi:hypothetical protein PVAG01_01654 [Phlyctema vagabunda]|uniref:Major facilitator superfamily (MFS) profile domain-containing protein n=1 Tax=Phlyctema vagabunda TaxID=108571 RepID=A0ABR4PXQ0_9HELO